MHIISLCGVISVCTYAVTSIDSSCAFSATVPQAGGE